MPLTDITNGNTVNSGAGTSADLNGTHVNRLIANKKGPKLWFGGYLFTLRKKHQTTNGVKRAYWSCTITGCKVSCKTNGVDTLDGLELGVNKTHSHGKFTSGEMVRIEMIEKGKLRARDLTNSIGQILDDLEKEYLTINNSDSVQWKRDNVMQVLRRERQKLRKCEPLRS